LTTKKRGERRYFLLVVAGEWWFRAEAGRLEIKFTGTVTGV
jgi:hypothetical protein